MERTDDEFVTITEVFWREGDQWFMWSELDPDTVHESPIYLMEIVEEG